MPSLPCRPLLLALVVLPLGVALVGGGLGCAEGEPAAPVLPVAPGARVIHGCALDAAGPMLDDRALRLGAARNETVGAVIQLANLPKPRDGVTLSLRIQPLQSKVDGGSAPAGNTPAPDAPGSDAPGADARPASAQPPSAPGATIGSEQFKVYQVMSMPVEANRAGYVRHTGLRASERAMPRALLPVLLRNGELDIGALRDPTEPFKPASRVGLSDEPVTLWLDVAVPPTAKAGTYEATLELLANGQKIESMPLGLEVYDFNLPDDRHLQMVGRLEWDSLEAHYPDLFPNVTPNLLNRKDPRHAAAVRVLDQFIKLAQEHRTTLVVPRLQPIAKWMVGQPWKTDWEYFDSVAGPWLSGEAFRDKVPLGYWPLPPIDHLSNYEGRFRLQYWQAAAKHFTDMGWIDRSWVEVEKDTPGRAKPQECVKLSLRAAELLRASDRIKVSLPMEDPQLQFMDAGNKDLLDRGTLPRVMASAPGLVYMPVPPDRRPPPNSPQPAHWLRTDLPGLVPYVGAGGDERDVRTWALLASLRRAQVIGWDGALPHARTPQEPADPNELTWFYPGRWFGIDEPVPTVQLKWLRRAQQDFEYFDLARQRGKWTTALVLARVMLKPVQIALNEEPDPTHGLFSGTADPKAWDQALRLAARAIMLREPGKESGTEAEKAAEREKAAALDLELLQFARPLEVPLLVAREAGWGWAPKPGNWVGLKLGLDVYNGRDMPLQGELSWAGAPRAWEYMPQPVPIDPTHAVGVYEVRRFFMEATVDLDRLSPEARKPVQLKFVDAERQNQPRYVTVSAPVAAADKREGRLVIDGALGDWDDGADAIHLGPLTPLLDRPSLQAQAVQAASTSSSLYANWQDKNFYFAFKLDGLSREQARVERSGVDFQLRRAWGEDLCELLIQPLYTRPGDVGQIVHVVCKPRGQIAVSVKPSPRNQRVHGPGHRPVVGSNVQFATVGEGSTWRGELAIPWELLNDADHQGQRPTLVRFNFVQHKAATGESASWAGPVDFGQDDGMMGLLYLRDAKSPGMGR